MFRLRRMGALVFALWVLVPASRPAAGAGQDWPQFRGLHRDGVSRESGLLGEWPEGGPAELWRRPFGAGYSAVTVVGDRLYTMYTATEDGKEVEFAAAFAAATGEELWRTAIGGTVVAEFGNGPRSTPTVDDGLVYVLGSLGDLAALSADDGSEKWRLSLPETFDTSRPLYGYSTSPLVDGDLLLVESGGREDRCYTALDKKTGETLWTAGEEPAGYNSPLPVTIDGRRHLVFVTGQTIGALDAEGHELWAYTFANVETHAMPIFLAPDKIFVSGVGGEGAQLLRIGHESDEMTVEQVWENPTMRNHFSSSVLHDGTIYGFDTATLKAISAETGELRWAKRGLGKGSLIVAGDRLVVLSDRGKLVLAEATPEGWREKGSVQALEGKCWTAPTLAAGKLYLRNHTEMVCYDLRR